MVGREGSGGFKVVLLDTQMEVCGGYNIISTVPGVVVLLVAGALVHRLFVFLKLRTFIVILGML